MQNEIGANDIFYQNLHNNIRIWEKIEHAGAVLCKAKHSLSLNLCKEKTENSTLPGGGGWLDKVILWLKKNMRKRFNFQLIHFYSVVPSLQQKVSQFNGPVFI